MVGISTRPGFSYSGPDWLEYLDIYYGLRGEAGASFLQYLRRLAHPPLSPKEDVRFIVPVVRTVYWKDNATG